MAQTISTPNGLLGSLPAELQLSIFAHLDYPSAIFLSSANRYFRHVVHPLELVPYDEKYAFLRSVQQYPRHAGDRSFACFRCYRVLPRVEFAEKHTRGAYNKNHTKEGQRFCMECGEKKGIYTRGSQVRKADGVLYWKCMRCPRLKSGLYCTFCTECHDCLGLTPEFNGKRCPKCDRDRIEGEKRYGVDGEKRHGGLDKQLALYGVPIYADNPIKEMTVGRHMSEWEEEFGETASPEWFEDHWWD